MKVETRLNKISCFKEHETHTSLNISYALSSLFQKHFYQIYQIKYKMITSSSVYYYIPFKIILFLYEKHLKNI